MIERPGSPEQVNSRPPTLLKQVKDILERDQRVESWPAFVVGKIKSYEGPTSRGPNRITEEWSFPEEARIDVFVSSWGLLGNADQLNQALKLLLERLRVGGINVAPVKIAFAEKADKKGGIKYPFISYPGETLRRITYTKQAEVLMDDCTEPKNQPDQKSIVEIKRLGTTIVIFPGEQVVDLAWLDLNDRPKKFRDPFIDRRLTERQLQLLRKNKVRLLPKT